ncbi:MAG: hypothetical protein KMY54_07735, partial [Erysipelothrix sp.]|nr:hypothetical protein [Erysipelothrix sp.]
YNSSINIGLYNAAVANELRVIYADFDGLQVQYHNQLTYPYGEHIADFSGASFVVANSIDDRLPPTLESIESSPKLVSINDDVLLDIVLSDNLSGIKFVEVAYNTPSGSFISVPVLLTNETTVQLVHNVQKYHESGLYTVRYVRIEDQAGNAAFYVSEYLGYTNENIYDFSEASFTVEGTLPLPTAPDTVVVSVDKPLLIGSDSTVLRITVDKTHQDYSYAQAYYINEFGESRGYHLTYIGNGVFECTLQTSLYEKAANYILTNIQIRFDEYGGFAFYNEAYDPTQSPSMDLSGGNYSLTGTLPFPTAPDYVNASVDKPVLIGDDDTVLRLVVDKTYQAYHYALAYYSNQYGETLTYHMTYIGEGQFEGSISSSRNDREADYQLIYIQFLIGIDDDGYGSDLFTIFNEAYDPLSTPSMDLNGGNYTVTGTMYDVQPAQLTGFFVSPSIATIGQKVTYNLDFMDDVSGVHYVEMHVTDEQGRGYWFTQYDQSNISFEFDVSKYTVGGAYTVRYVRVDDNAGNQVFYVSQSLGYSNEIVYDFSGAIFMVEGTLPLPTAPDSVSVSIDKPMLVGADSTVIRVTVDKAYQEYSYVYAHYINQFGESRGYHLNYIGNGVFESTISASLYEREANYQLTFINIYIDEYGGFTFFNEAYDPTQSPSMDLSGGDYSVTETEFGNAPRFDYLSGSFDLEMVTKDQIVKYTLYLDNPNHHFEVIYATFYNEHEREITMQLYPIGEGAYQGEYYIETYTTPGTYQLRYLQSTISDYWVYSEHMEGGTEFPYFDFSGVTFEVYGTVFDIEPPYIENSTVNMQLVEKGDLVVFDFYLADADSYPTGGYITLIHEGNVGYEIEMLTFNLEQVDQEHFRIPLYIHSYVKNGRWSVYRIYLWDAAGNSMEYYNTNHYSDYNPVDLSHLDFVVQNNIEDNTPPTLNSVEMMTPEVYPNGLVKVRLDIQDDYSDIQKVHLSFIGKSTQQWFSIEAKMLGSGVNIISDYAWSGYISDEYELIFINMSDWAGNWVTICNTENMYAGMYCSDDVVSQSIPNVKFQLNEGNPIQQATFIEEFNITPSVVEAGQEIQITIKLAAEYWGASAVYVSFPEVEYPNTYPSFEMVNMGSGIFTGKLRIDNKLKWQSEYRVGSIELHYPNQIITVVNESDAEVYYSGHSYVSDFSHLRFSVMQTNADQTSPEIGTISIGKNSYTQSENLVFNMFVNEPESNVENIIFRFRVDGEIVEYPFGFG